MGGWGGGWAPLGSAAIRRSGRCSRRRGSPAWPPGAAAPGPGSVAGGLGRTWTRDQGPRPLPGRIPSPREHPRPGGCVANQPRRLAVWGRAGDSNLREEKKHDSRWFVFTRLLKACSSARWLSFFATFFGKAPRIRKRRAEHLQVQVSPKKTFFQSWLCSGGPSTRAGRGANSRPGRVAGRERVRPGVGPKRRARLLRARGAPTARWADPGRQVDAARVSRSIRPPARCSGRPLRVSSCGSSGLLVTTRLGGGLFLPSFPFCACVYVCVRKISLEKKRWALAAGGEPSGRQRGRQAGCSGLQEKLPPFSCSGLYKGEGRVQEVGGDSLSSPGPESAPGGGQEPREGLRRGLQLKGSLRARQPL